RLQAGLAADAGIRVEFHDAVRPPVHRRGRTDRDAGRIRAVVAPRDLEEAPRVREGSLLDVLDPRALDSQRNRVLGLARGRAGVAADASPVVDDEREVHGSSAKNPTPGAPLRSRRRTRV